MRTTPNPWLMVLALAALVATSLATEWRIAKLNSEDARLLQFSPSLVQVPAALPAAPPGRPSTS
jgi:hypothetical protein